jgi:hypothetical protein
MKTHVRFARTFAVCAGLVAAISIAPVAAAQVDLLPNLEPLPAHDISLVCDSLGNQQLRFAATTWNSGAGPMELRAGEVVTAGRNVYQRIYRIDGSFTDRLAGTFDYHPEHNHFHFENYALYVLQPRNAPGGSERTSAKTSFCLLDNARINTSLPGSPGSAVYTTCGAEVQGISVGWGDTYGSILAGQSIDFTGNPSGEYELIIEADPATRLVEVSDGDNISCALLRIDVDAGRCNVNVASTGCDSPDPVVVSAIQPNSVRRGSAVEVTITGSGFFPGVVVSFENGTSQRPTATNVVVRDGNTITATVSVKNGGPPRARTWDVRVGSGVLVAGFTVSP